MKKTTRRPLAKAQNGKSVNVNVSGKMGRIDADKVRKEQASSGKSYTFTKVDPGRMSSSDSSYVKKFEKSPSLVNKKKGGAVKAKKKK